MSLPSFKGIEAKELAGAICAQLKKNGVEAILVGGAVVTIYTDNWYVSKDLDFVTNDAGKKTITAMTELGFTMDKGGDATHPDTDFYVEFLKHPVEIGADDNIKPKEMSTALGSLKLVSPIDIIKDRLIAYQEWDDPQSLEQAIGVCKNQKISFEELKTWAKKEGYSKTVNTLEERVKE